MTWLFIFIVATGSKPDLTTSAPFRTPYPGYNGTIPTNTQGPTSTLRPPDFQFVTPTARPPLFAGETPTPRPYCDIPLGVANPLVVSDSQLSASTSYNFSFEATRGRLNGIADVNGAGAWIPRYNFTSSSVFEPRQANLCL